MKLSSNENSQSMVIGWSGRHKKNPSLTMTGTLRFGGNKSVYYTEALYNQAKLDHVTVAQCKVKEENAPLPDLKEIPTCRRRAGADLASSQAPTPSMSGIKIAVANG
jgi:hypothetical protein